MRVYKFRSKQWGLEALKKRKLKVSPLDELNDPFEYLAVNIGDRSVRKFIRERRKFLGKNGAIISFCANWSNPVTWSHYAEDHRGIALGFDIPEKLLFKMQYSDCRIPIDASDLNNPEALDKLLQNLGRTKFKHWEYEDEYRLFFDLTRAKKESPTDKMFFQPFEDGMELKEVILGCRYESDGNRDLEKELLGSGVLFTTARAAFKEFKMTKQLNTKLNKRL